MTTAPRAQAAGDARHRPRVPAHRHRLGGATPGRRLALALLLAALGGVLAACNLFRGDPPPCPPTAIVRGADTITVYRPGADEARSGADDVRYLGALADVVSACRYDDGAVAVDLALAVVAERGPAYTGAAPVDLTYFVAVVGPGGDLLGRETFTTSVAIPEGARRAGVAEELTQIIPGVEPAEAGAYRILLGFRLDEEEVRRRREGRPPRPVAPPALPAPTPQLFTE